MNVKKIVEESKGKLQIISRNQLLKGNKIKIELPNSNEITMLCSKNTIKELEEQLKAEENIEIDNITLYRNNETILFIKPYDVWHEVL